MRDNYQSAIEQWAREHRPTYTRDDLVRAILGQQWAVAIACHDPWGTLMGSAAITCTVSRLPSPDDVVTAMEQV